MAILGVPQEGTAQIRFAERPDSGVDFVHTSGRSENRYLPEIMGAGAAWIDYDGDGIWDLYLVDSGTLPGIRPLTPAPPEAGINRLFRGLAGGRFERTEGSGAEDRGYGMGVAAADYDNDGWVDLYVSNYGHDALFRNNGDGTFEDVSGLVSPEGGWSTSIAWGDLDLDGWNDLWVTQYVEYPLESVPLCTNMELGVRQYCPPPRLDAAGDRLLYNDRGTRFRDVSLEAGVADDVDGKGLAVALVDFTDDRLPDVYVANDTTRNFMYVNRGGMTFTEEGLLSGTALSDYGQPQAGMGVAVGDLDADGDYEIGVTNYLQEPVNLYSPTPGGPYMDSSYVWGIGDTTLPTLGFGLAFLDADGDGDLDLAIANGHVLDEHPFWAQPNQVFRNDRIVTPRVGREQGVRFVEVTESVGEVFELAEVSRGLAVADADTDGRPDMVITNTGGPARLLWNVGDPGSGRLVVRLRGTSSNRDALGASVRIRARSRVRAAIDARQPVVAGSSYLSQNATDLYFGLGDADAVSLEITWPDGTREELSGIAPDRLLLVQQGRGLVAARPLEARR